MVAKINVRQKGLAYERKIINELKELLGDDEIGSSRNLNRYMDSLKCDIVNVPMFNIQCKAMESTPTYHSILKEMPSDAKMNVVFHKRNNKGEIVVMTKEDFYRIFKLLISD